MEELDSRNMTLFDRSNADAAHEYVISSLAQGAIKEVHIEASFRLDEAEAYCVIDGAEGSCRIFEGPGSSLSTAMARVELMRALSTSPSLRTLALQAEGHFTEEEVCELFGGIASNSCPSLTTLSIQIDRLAAAATATTKPTTIKRTSFSEALATNRTIESLDIAMDKGSYSAEGSQELLNPWHGLLSSLRSWDCSIESLNISIRGFDEAVSFPFLDRDLRALADVLLRDNRSVSRLKLSSLPSFTILPEEFQGLLQRNTRLTSLTFPHFDLRLVGGFDGIFHSLASNSSLHRLDLSACEGSWSLASILDSLHSNGRISDVSYKSTPLEHDDEGPVIEAQLARNRTNANRMEALSPNFRVAGIGTESFGYWKGRQKRANKVKLEKASNMKPTRCRLFLCGRPYAGLIVRICTSYTHYK